MKTNWKSTPRDVILTTAFGLTFRKASLFFRSLAKTDYAGRVLVFTANLSQGDRAAYAGMGAKVLDHGVHLHRMLRRPLQVLLWPAVRNWPDSGSFSPPWDRLQQPNVLRWSLYRRYLLEHRAEFDRILMVDLRDVCFQGDPFEGVEPSGLRVHAEEGDVTVCRSEWNTLAMRGAFGEEGIGRWGQLRVSCSGVVAGGIEPVLTYLEAYRSLLPDLSLPDHGTDQILHTLIVHGELAPSVRWQGNREGDVVHLASVQDISSFARDDHGRLLNESGVPFTILHQFDRHPALAAELQKVHKTNQ